MIQTIKSMLYVTASLLESWRYCLINGNLKEFEKVLKKEKKEIDILERGLQFEKEVINGNDECFSKIVEGGAYQFYGKKILNIDGNKVLLKGYLDVLKDSIIYDIKRPAFYKSGKYYDSFQKDCYFELVPNAKEFIFLIYDGENYYSERYFREDRRNIHEVIKQFYKWLKTNDLFNLYEENWRK